MITIRQISTSIILNESITFIRHVEYNYLLLILVLRRNLVKLQTLITVAKMKILILACLAGSLSSCIPFQQPGLGFNYYPATNHQGSYHNTPLYRANPYYSTNSHNYNASSHYSNNNNYNYLDNDSDYVAYPVSR